MSYVFVKDNKNEMVHYVVINYMVTYIGFTRKGEVFVALQYQATKGEFTEDSIIFHINESAGVAGYSATGNMLVDSDNLSFVYLLDGDEGYTYIRFQEDVWPTLKDVLDNNLKVLVTDQTGETIELVEVKEELDYLVENIKGNSNYGNEMNQAVENVFLTAAS